MKELRKSPTRDIGWGLFDDPFDNMFEGFFRPMRTTALGEGLKHTPAVDVIERDTEYRVKADLPGIKKDDIHVDLQDDTLTISAETKEEYEKKEGEVLLRQERHYGKFVRCLRLAHHIDDSKVKANFKDGVLELVLPKLEAEIPKKTTVPIN